MKILVTGSNGLLGQHLVKLLLEKGYHVIASGKGGDRLSFSPDPLYKYVEADITDLISMEKLINGQLPDVIIHAGAMTQVDICEQEHEKCYDVNVNATKMIAALAERNKSFLIYISTDFVFDGEEGNYREDDEMNPVNFYGVTKAEAEKIVARVNIPYAIARTCLVYGNILQGTRSNIISWVKEKLEKKEKIKVVDDQVRTPTYIEDLANGIVLIIQKKATGIFHISGEEILTPYEMAMQSADFFGLDKDLIERVNASIFSQPAKRPMKTGFNINKAKAVLNYQPGSFKEGLQKMFKK
ncbi:MAG: dTDP-4-dehydrorhamnose reductase [Bacteroidetes bacterium]|nr:dTDP-4-dehydrorhamnose reductase [Bacteroidota bacterium]